MIGFGDELKFTVKHRILYILSRRRSRFDGLTVDDYKSENADSRKFKIEYVLFAFTSYFYFFLNYLQTFPKLVWIFYKMIILSSNTEISFKILCIKIKYFYGYLLNNDKIGLKKKILKIFKKVYRLIIFVFKIEDKDLTMYYDFFLESNIDIKEWANREIVDEYLRIIFLGDYYDKREIFFEKRFFASEYVRNYVGVDEFIADVAIYLSDNAFRLQSMKVYVPYRNDIDLAYCIVRYYIIITGNYYVINFRPIIAANYEYIEPELDTLKKPFFKPYNYAIAYITVYGDIFFKALYFGSKSVCIKLFKYLTKNIKKLTRFLYLITVYLSYNEYYKKLLKKYKHFIFLVRRYIKHKKKKSILKKEYRFEQSLVHLFPYWGTQLLSKRVNYGAAISRFNDHSINREQFKRRYQKIKRYVYKVEAYGEGAGFY